MHTGRGLHALGHAEHGLGGGGLVAEVLEVGAGGVLEALAGGLISSHFKDAVAFCVLLFTLFVRPAGLLGRGSVERV